MSKSSKPKKDKVPKITEAEYAAYLSTLKGMTEGGNVSGVSGTPTGAPMKKE